MKYEAGQVFHAQDIGEANALASQLRSEGFCSNLRRDEDGGYYEEDADYQSYDDSGENWDDTAW